MLQTALAAIGHDDPLFRAGVTGKLDDVDQRRRVIVLRNLRIVDSGGNGTGFPCRADRHTHGSAQPLSQNRPLQKDIVPVSPFLAGQDFKGDLLKIRLAAALVGKPCNFSENLPPQIGLAGI